MSNINVTPGSGKVVATETIGGIEYQQVKLIDPTATSTTPIGTTANPLNVSNSAQNSAVSTNNSSTATLTSGSVFTGTGEEVTTYSELRITVFSNVASATDGLSIQQSSDNTNWDITDVYTVAASGAGAGKTYVVPRQAKYFRVVYTNGGTNQTTFRLQTILNRQGTAPSSNRPTDGYTNETDLTQGQAFNMLHNGTTWDRQRAAAAGDITNGTGLTGAQLYAFDNGTGYNRLGLLNSAADGQSGGRGLTVGSLLFNGSNYDRQRNNYNVNTGDTGAKTTTFNGATQTNYNAKGANILFNIGTVTGVAPTLVAKLQGSSDDGTTWYDIPGATTTSLTATGTTLLTIYPGATVAANASVSYPLSRTWRVAYTIGGTTPSFTVTNVQVGYIL